MKVGGSHGGRHSFRSNCRDFLAGTRRSFETDLQRELHESSVKMCPLPSERLIQLDTAVMRVSTAADSAVLYSSIHMQQVTPIPSGAL